MVCTFSRHDLEHRPRTAQDLARSLEQMPLNSPILQYRSWMGDRGGNHHQITQSTIEALHAAARKLWDEHQELHRELSPSVRRVNLPETQSIWSTAKTNVAMNPCGFGLRHYEMAFKTTPFQQHSFVMNCLPSGAISSQPVCLRLPTPALDRRHCPISSFWPSPRKLDIRQHSQVHLSALSELFRHAGIHDTFPRCPRLKRWTCCERTCQSTTVGRAAFTLKPNRRSASNTQSGRAAQAPRKHHWLMHCFNDPPCSDLLVLRLLMKEVGFELTDDRTPSGSSSKWRICTALDLLQGILNEPTLSPRGNEPVEIMLGYSDSNKDGGFLSANVALHEAQKAMSQVAKASGKTIRFFHGRGDRWATAAVLAAYLLHQPGRCTARSGLPNKEKSSASGTPCLKLPTGTLNKSFRLPSLRQMMGTKTTTIWPHPSCVNWPSPCGIIASLLRTMTSGHGSLPPLRSKRLRDSHRIDRYHVPPGVVSIRKSSPSHGSSLPDSMRVLVPGWFGWGRLWSNWTPTN